MRALAEKVHGVAHVEQIVGLKGAMRAASSNAAALFLTFGPAAERARSGYSMQSILRAMQVQTAAIDPARIIVRPHPAVPGLGFLLLVGQILAREDHIPGPKGEINRVLPR